MEAEKNTITKQKSKKITPNFFALEKGKFLLKIKYEGNTPWSV